MTDNLARLLEAERRVDAAPSVGPTSWREVLDIYLGMWCVLYPRMASIYIRIAYQGARLCVCRALLWVIELLGGGKGA